MDEIVGTANFTHRDPLTKEKWTSLKQYDQASLAYVIRVVNNGGQIPWTSIEGTFNYLLDERDRSTKEWLEETDCLNKDMADFLLEQGIYYVCRIPEMRHDQQNAMINITRLKFGRS